MKRLKVAIAVNALYVTQAGTARDVKGLLNGLKDEDVDVIPFAWEVKNHSYKQPDLCYNALRFMIGFMSIFFSSETCAGKPK